MTVPVTSVAVSLRGDHRAGAVNSDDGTKPAVVEMAINEVTEVRKCMIRLLAMRDFDCVSFCLFNACSIATPVVSTVVLLAGLECYLDKISCPLNISILDRSCY